MNGLGSQIIYKQLLQRHGQVRIPMIQRDYAQGRASEGEVRERFLEALGSALKLLADDPSLPLNLDFIYGSVEGQKETRFYPLDGQQRLTTLFLLHWYLAWQDGCWEEFGKLFRGDAHARFSYSVRPSSNEFFDELVVFEPKIQPKDVDHLSGLITDQQWYFRHWRLDPTIVSALTMLDAIHRRFAGGNGLFARLTSEDRPAITFQLLDLENFGLSDDLYIKMNARGKPLTSFETFKARYEQELTGQFSGVTRRIGNQEFPIGEFVARRMDTSWADFFWKYRDRKTHLYDEAIMNLFRVVALVTRSPESKAYIKDVALLRDNANPPSYTMFHAQGWLDSEFTETLIALLEHWSSGGSELKPLLSDARYFDEVGIFGRLIRNPTTLTLPEIIQFSGYALFVRQHEKSLDAGALWEWMRVVQNLALNSYVERADELRSSARGLRELLPKSTKILEHLAQLGPADKVTGFNEQQVSEEKLKAGLILHHVGWRPLIDRAENHGYFRGQIEFLCEFSGAAEQWKTSGKFDWDDQTHLNLQERLKDYLAKAEMMFTGYGLFNLGQFRWQRALLAIGDYLLPSGQNLSFLVSAPTDPASWKRLLRATGPLVPKKRKLLQQFWDRLTLDRPVEEQLDEIIADASGLEPWIEAFVRTPEALEYCGRRAIRWESKTRIYLLSKMQMNGAHAELFTFCLFQNSLRRLDEDRRLLPLKLADYESVIGRDDEPHVHLIFPNRKHRLRFRIEFKGGLFYTRIARSILEAFPNVHALLCGSRGFKETELFLSKSSSPADIESSLIELAGLLATVPHEATSHD